MSFICVSACNAGAVACYSGLGAVFGTVTASAGMPPAILACNSALSACMVGCGVATGAAAIAAGPMVAVISVTGAAVYGIYSWFRRRGKKEE